MLEIRNLSKRFGPFDVLKSVDLRVEPGEIHGLVGVNGSGKSTLLNILFGSPVIAATGGYTGEVLMDGARADILTPAHAIKKGIGMIHQEFALLSSLNVAENITIRRECLVKATTMFGDNLALLDTKRNRKDAAQTLGRLGIDLDTGIRVMDLSVNMRQFVEIAREINRKDLCILLLDEPTAALHRGDVKRLFETLQAMADKGVALLYVSHRLEEIIALCHKVTVLRNAEVAGRFDRRDFGLDTISECMIGHKVIKAHKHTVPANLHPIVRLEGFSVDMPGEEVRNVDLEVYQGEILGLAGLSGQGRPALGYGIMGMYKTGGKVFIREEHVPVLSPASMIRHGVFLLPEDRRSMGLLPDHSVMENIVFAALQSRNAFLRPFPLMSLRLLDRPKALRYARECVERFGISCRGVHQALRELSGGNQQKVCIARALAIEPKVLFVSEPTRGVDIAAKENILNILLHLNRSLGTTLIIASSELDELKRICDRIAVFYDGEVLDILDPESTEKAFALAYSGHGRACR
jgi:simple sugar transport system ATP-binding protein